MDIVSQVEVERNKAARKSRLSWTIFGNVLILHSVHSSAVFGSNLLKTRSVSRRPKKMKSQEDSHWFMFDDHLDEIPIELFLKLILNKK